MTYPSLLVTVLLLARGALSVPGAQYAALVASPLDLALAFGSHYPGLEGSTGMTERVHGEENDRVRKKQGC